MSLRDIVQHSYSSIDHPSNDGRLGCGTLRNIVIPLLTNPSNVSDVRSPYGTLNNIIVL